MGARGASDAAADFTAVAGPRWDEPAGLNAVAREQIEESDVISFHNYGWPEDFARARA